MVRDNPRYNDSLRAAIDYLTTAAEAIYTRRSQVQRCRTVASLESGRRRDGGHGRGNSQETDVWSENGTTILNIGGYSVQQ